DFAAIGSEGGEGGVAVGGGLAVDVPGDSPALGSAVLQQASLLPGCFAARAGDRGERFDRDKAVRSGGGPGRAIWGEGTARDNIVDVGVVLELPTPGMQDAGAAREVGAEKALILGQPLEGHGRGLQQRMVRAAWLRAHQGTEGRRDGEGEEEVRPG